MKKTDWRLLWPLLLWIPCAWAVHSILTIFHPASKMTLAGKVLCVGIGLIPAAILTIKNLLDYYIWHDNTAVDPVSLWRNDPVAYQSPEKRKALYPPIPEPLKCNHPEGVLLGKTGLNYVRKPMEDDGHLMVIGGSGSGKSSCLAIPILLSKKPNIAVFALDIKGELHEKTCRSDDPDVRVISPIMPGAWAYDVFYRLHAAMHPELIITEEMRQIAYTLITGNAGGRDRFWTDSARDLLTGLLVYYYLAGHVEFLECVDLILSHNIQQQIKDIVDPENGAADQKSDAYKVLNKFCTMRDDTLGGIFSEVSNACTIFSTDPDLRRMLSQHYQRVNPLALDDGKSIFLHIPEDKLAIYYNLTRLIIDQVLLQLTRRSEDSEPVIVMIDELARILSSGRLASLLDAAATLRSRRVTLILITQSLEALEISYKHAEVESLLNNMTYIAVLSTSSTATSKIICERAGKFREKQSSYKTDGLIDTPGHGHINFQYRDVLEPTDLASLKARNEVVIISQDYGYFRCRKCPYYLDNQLQTMQEKLNPIVSDGIIGCRDSHII